MTVMNLSPRVSLRAVGVAVLMSCALFALIGRQLLSLQQEELAIAHFVAIGANVSGKARVHSWPMNLFLTKHAEVTLVIDDDAQAPIDFSKLRVIADPGQSSVKSRQNRR
jgi:hypothetical protein